MFINTTNGQQKSIAARNDRAVPLITDDFILFVTKIHVLKAVCVKYSYKIYLEPW